MLQLPFAGPSPSIARRRLLTFLRAHGIDRALTDDALLVLAEMVANAVAHGAPRPDGTVEVRWTLGAQELVLSVEDGGHPGPLYAHHVDVTAVSGRGLAIIERLADRWWVESDGGTRVCASLARSPVDV